MICGNVLSTYILISNNILNPFVWNGYDIKKRLFLALPADYKFCNIQSKIPYLQQQYQQRKRAENTSCLLSTFQNNLYL